MVPSEIGAMLKREACKPPIYASKATCGGFASISLSDYRRSAFLRLLFVAIRIILFRCKLPVRC